MKKFVVAALITATAGVAQAQTYTDQARVRSAEPVLENVSIPREECSTHWVQEPVRRVGRERYERNYGGAIVGGLAGGAIGHQFGGGAGKDAATALGVILGAMAGDQHQNRWRDERPDGRESEVVQRQVRQCRTVMDSQSRITGYRVAYEYRGQQYTTFTRNHPGEHLAVRVSVEPIER